MKNKSNISSTKKRLKLSFILIVAVVLIFAVAIVTILERVIVLSGLSTQDDLEHSGTYLIFVFGVASVIIGLFFAYLLSRMVLKPFDALLDGMTKLSDGDFSVRVCFENKKYFNELSDRFNSLAAELENTQILRSDFVNNFSHEFKTPIASVVSLIPLLKNNDLPKAKRDKYLSIIQEEMDRLASMTTNVLNLSKIETQEILSEKTKFNISEQIRNCVLLFEKKWTKKKLKLSLDFDEYNVYANEDMLKQVWINLLDNAIKFSVVGGELNVFVVSEDSKIKIVIENTGSTIREDEYDKIFNKFYRAENNNVKDGNGIGLSIVKHIVSLHEGEIFVKSYEDKTAFTVVLPN